MQFVGVGRVGPRLAAHPRDGFGVEPADVAGRLGREPAAAHHRLSAALLERRVVEIGVGPGRQHLESERRGLGQIARDDANFAGFEPLQQPFEAADVHRLAEAVGDGLADQRMVRDLALADQIFGAGNLVGKDRRDQVLGRHPGELRRHLLPPRNRGSASDTPATQRQRVMNIGASSNASIKSRLMLAECR